MRQSQPVPDRATAKLQLCSMLTAPSLQRCAATVPAFTRSIAPTTRQNTAVSFKNDTLALAERAKGEDSIAPLAKLPHVMFFGGGVVIKLGDEVIGSIGASGAPGAKLDDGCAHAGLDKIRDQLR